MAKRGSNKALSVGQEDYIAKMYGGKRSPSSGGAENDQGDVRTPTELIEAKTTGGPGRVPKKKATIVRTFEKVFLEATSEGREAVLALRYFDPESPLADVRGWVDLAVRRMDQDAYRSNQLRDTANGN